MPPSLRAVTKTILNRATSGRHRHESPTSYRSHWNPIDLGSTMMRGSAVWDTIERWDRRVWAVTMMHELHIIVIHIDTPIRLIQLPPQHVSQFENNHSHAACTSPSQACSACSALRLEKPMLTRVWKSASRAASNAS